MIQKKWCNLSSLKFTINRNLGRIARTKTMFKRSSRKCFNWNTLVHSDLIIFYLFVCPFWSQVYFLEELLSPFVTPLILCIHLRRRSLQIIDFLRNYTISVQGVGDVCSFSQLDVAKNGNLKVRRSNRTDRSMAEYFSSSGSLLSSQNQALKTRSLPMMVNSNYPWCIFITPIRNGKCRDSRKATWRRYKNAVRRASDWSINNVFLCVTGHI